MILLDVNIENFFWSFETPFNVIWLHLHCITGFFISEVEIYHIFKYFEIFIICSNKAWSNNLNLLEFFLIYRNNIVCFFYITNFIITTMN